MFRSPPESTVAGSDFENNNNNDNNNRAGPALYARIIEGQEFPLHNINFETEGARTRECCNSLSNWPKPTPVARVTSFEALFSRGLVRPLAHERHSTRRNSWHHLELCPLIPSRQPLLTASITTITAHTTAVTASAPTTITATTEQLQSPLRHGQGSVVDSSSLLSTAGPHPSPPVSLDGSQQSGGSGSGSGSDSSTSSSGGSSPPEMQEPLHPLAQAPSTQAMADENQSPSSLETAETIENHDTPSPTSTISNNTPHVDHVPRPPPPVMTLSLGSLSNFQPQRQQPIFNPADTPPPYSPTHTILPHYFSLVPIPIRSYTIKESSTLPSLLDFWLHTTSSHNNNSSSSTRPSSPAQERLQLQERGQPRQTGGPELKYSLIRPTQSDRTAIPPGHPSFTQDTFIPPWALVKADFPARWIWWGTEALHLVVFGRQLKNVYMEWRWRRGRSRIGGPVITRLIGCSFRITPERGYCWRQGTGRATNLTMTTPPPSRQRSRLHRSSTETRATRSAHTVVEMGNEGGSGGGSTHWNNGRAANLQDDDLSASRSSRGSRSFFSRLFPSRSRSSAVSAAAAAAATNVVAPSISTSPSPSPQATPPPTITVSPSSPTSVELQRLPSVSSPSHPLEDSTVYTTGEPPGGDIPGPADRVSILHRLDSRGSVVALSDIAEEDLGRNLPPASHNAGGADGDGHEDSHSHIYNHSHNNDVHYEEEDDDEDNDTDTDTDDEVGVYHCREESIEGVPGRLVAVYRPARAANRAQDLAARSCKLEIYAEIGERCETALMFMCSRLDDLFMAIPESKRMPLRQQQQQRRRRRRQQQQQQQRQQRGRTLHESPPLTSMSSFGGSAVVGAVGRAGHGLTQAHGRERGGRGRGGGLGRASISSAGGGDVEDDADLPAGSNPKGPMTLKDLLRQDKTRRVLKMVVATALIVLVIVLVLRSSKRPT